ncbi:MAG: amidohydrolase family protein [Thermoproteota archaeon]|nr:amidohydrolase family protein [Thermoproteota archaeon]
MNRIIERASLLLGRDLKYVESGFIEIGENGTIIRAGVGNYSEKVLNNKTECNSCKINSEGLLVIPGFINAHTHIGDSLAKDVLADSGLNTRIHPVYGAKKAILQKSKPGHLASLMRASVISMMRRGIVAFADFREGGYEGLELLNHAISSLPIKCIVLGRIEYYFDLIKDNNIGRKDELAQGISSKMNIKPKHQAVRKTQQKLPLQALQQVSDILKVAGGLGISGANENTDLSLQQYKQLIDSMNKRKKDKKLKKEKENENENRKLLLAIHGAESRESVEFSKSVTGKTEVFRIMQFLKPDYIVHMTNATDEDISLVASNRTGVVICPRANGVLGAGVPRVADLLSRGCMVAIGTDNVMLNSPDIFREMDYVWKTSRAIGGYLIEASDILKMATVNAAHILGLNSGCIEEGRSADLLFIDKKHLDLYPMHNPYVSIIHRASSESIKAIMIDGKLVDGAELCG